MPAVPVYSASPVNAAKASGTTPQTARPDEPEREIPGYVAQVTTSSAASQQGFPAPQPGAGAPSQPVQTANAIQPTPTHQSLPDDGPPAPQPGAVPVPPPGAASHLPPPPKPTEARQYTPATTVPMPPQMSYQAPSSQYSRGSSTTTAPPPAAGFGGPRPTSIREGGPGDVHSHPPGYHQDVHASEFSSAQRVAHESSMAENTSVFDGDDDEGVWGAAKKWASAAGNRLAAAENEVWRRINKD